MPSNLTDNYVANTYKGVLHANGEELPDNTKVQVYDGAGNKTAIILGIESIDCISLSAYGLTANDFKYPDIAGNRFDVMCQVTSEAQGEVNTLELKNIKDIFCGANAGPTYTREEESVVPVVQTQCGIVTNIDDVPIVDITTAAGGMKLAQSGNFSIATANIDGGLVKGLTLSPISQPINPNLLINAQGVVNQRQIISGSTLNYEWNPNKYFLDRWKSVNGSPVSWSYNINRNIATITAAAGVSQTIESINIIPGSYILSWTGTAIATVREGNVVKATGTGGNGPVKELLVNVGGGGNIQITFTNGTFSLPKFERGSIRTEFDYRDFAAELLLCQRYFSKTYDYITRPGQSAMGAIEVQHPEPIQELHNNGWRFPTRMRVKPKAWVFNPRTGNINQFYFWLSPGVDGVRPAVVNNWSDSGISTSTNEGQILPAGVDNRVVSTHYVVDAEF